MRNLEFLLAMNIWPAVCMCVIPCGQAPDHKPSAISSLIIGYKADQLPDYTASHTRRQHLKILEAYQGRNFSPNTVSDYQLQGKCTGLYLNTGRTIAFRWLITWLLKFHQTQLCVHYVTANIIHMRSTYGICVCSYLQWIFTLSQTIVDIATCACSCHIINSELCLMVFQQLFN